MVAAINLRLVTMAAVVMEVRMAGVLLDIMASRGCLRYRILTPIYSLQKKV